MHYQGVLSTQLWTKPVSLPVRWLVISELQTGVYSGSEVKEILLWISLWFLAVACDCLQVDKALEQGGKREQQKNMQKCIFPPPYWLVLTQTGTFFKLNVTLMTFHHKQVQTGSLLFFDSCNSLDTVLLLLLGNRKWHLQLVVPEIRIQNCRTQKEEKKTTVF